MSKHAPPVVEATCTEKCRLKEHGNNITSAITKFNLTDFQLACYISSICRNYAQVLDEEGRTALHMAASTGRKNLCYWLIKAGRADLNLRDKESGYTPLHRTIFYGHINIAVFFIEMGAQVKLMDKDDFLAADQAVKDRVIKAFSVHNPCQAYVWGTNHNYTLGTGNQQSRQQPELLDFFRKKNIFIKQVAMDKFHSVFVSTGGRVWSCGHGQSGRLGVEGGQTVLTPQPVKVGGEVVMSASVSRDHTILLMESNTVWTCGSNSYHVLGHSPPPSALFTPRPIPPKILKAGGAIIGVAAARFHSVFWSSTSVLTCGLNGGQLGHPQLVDKTVVIPKKVKGLSFDPKFKIVDVACSTGATVVSISRGDIYLLHNYQVRRIVSRIPGSDFVIKVSVFGGELNAGVDQKLKDKDGEELRVMVLTSKGNVLWWQESFPQLTRCIHPLKRSLTFCRMHLCLSSVLLITDDGEAFKAQIKVKAKKQAITPSPKSETVNFNQFIEKLDCHHMSLSRVPHIHRAVDIAADPRGDNFVVIQEDPKVNLTDIPLLGESEFSQQMASLLRDAHEDDYLHDVLIEVDNITVPAHHFVLAQASEEFANTGRSGNVKTVKLPGVHVEVLHQILNFAYTHDCEVIHPGPFQPHNFKGDIIKATLDLAKRWKMTTLVKCLQLLRYQDGQVVVKEGDPFTVRQAQGVVPRWERSMMPALCDVALASSDGATFKAHKCVLAARLEYFNSMFTGGWVEADATKSLTLHIPQTILREVLDFLYTDEAPALLDSQDVDYISSVLVVANQLLIMALEKICEVALANNLSLRNAAYLLQLAITYNTDQLKSCCLQFIGLNLPAILETRVLEIIDDKTLDELSKYYRNMIPAMCKRIITPFSTQPSEEDIIDISSSYPVTWLDSEELTNDSEGTTAKLRKSNPSPVVGKKRTQRSRRSSESQRKRFESVSSSSDLDCSIEVTPNEKLDLDDLVELAQTNKEEEWMVDKTHKSKQSWMNVIVSTSSVLPISENFTRLGPAHSTSPPLNDDAQFPQLNTNSKVSSSPKSCYVEIKRSPLVKLSQKQRKKMLADGEGVVSDPPPVRTPWAIVNTDPDCSLADIMRSALTAGSSPTSSEQTPGKEQVKFSDIMADEIQQRANFSKMKSKSLQLTQIEDKAMEELRVFYNAANMFDERITVERVLSANIAKPMWITSRHQ